MIHMMSTSDSSVFRHIKEMWDFNQKVTIENNIDLEAIGVENVPIKVPNGEKCYLENVL